MTWSTVARSTHFNLRPYFYDLTLPFGRLETLSLFLIINMTIISNFFVVSQKRLNGTVGANGQHHGDSSLLRHQSMFGTNPSISDLFGLVVKLWLNQTFVVVIFRCYLATIGRRRRSVDDDFADEVIDERSIDGPAMEILNRAVRDLQQSTEEPSLKQFKSDKMEEEEESGVTESGAFLGNQTEDSQVEGTTEIIEFNLDGKLNKYIVKKEVQAIIVDVPELLESSDSETLNTYF
jgi:hypothetical protein